MTIGAARSLENSGGQKGKAMCIKLDSGQVMWEEHKGFVTEISSPVMTDGKIIAFAAGGLCMIRATPDKCELLCEAKMQSVRCTSPAVADGRLYVRVTKGGACYDLRAQPPNPHDGLPRGAYLSGVKMGVPQLTSGKNPCHPQ
jgi:outer membrane protein assembly factor BamB